MSRRVRRRHFPRAEQHAFLAKTGEMRRVCIRAMARAPINAQFYRSLMAFTDAIDGVAEAVTGSRRHFHDPPLSASLGLGRG